MGRELDENYLTLRASEGFETGLSPIAPFPSAQEDQASSVVGSQLAHVDVLGEELTIELPRRVGALGVGVGSGDDEAEPQTRGRL